MSLRRADPRFLLPVPVERAVVLGDLAPWAHGLRQAGVEVALGDGGSATPQLAVAPARRAREAVATGAGMILLEGRRGTVGLQRAGLEARRYIPTPSLEAPNHLVPVHFPHATRYAIEHWSVPTDLARRVRNRAAVELLSRGVFPEVRPLLSVGLRRPGPPFFLVAAEECGVARDSEWFMTLGGGDALSRGVFHVFARGEDEPSRIVKFARVLDYPDAFDRDERGLRLARAAGPEVAARVPTVLGRLEVAGLHASVEVAAVGERLTDMLLRPGPRAGKLAVIEAVADWILEVGRRTAAPPETLAAERRRLAETVVPRWSGFGIPGDLVDAVPAVPAVLQHNDAASWNVIARGAGAFTLIDWEAAKEHGFPLWDLVYFLAEALRQLDGVVAREARDAHTAGLFRGELESSDILFRWIARAVEQHGIPEDAVGAIVTLCWLHHGVSYLERAEARDQLAAGTRWGEVDVERVARLWVTEPGLGPSWSAWRSG
jgi:hypothetical protein